MFDAASKPSRAYLELVKGRFAQHELAIRRKLVQDPNFREILEDYQAALRARARWSGDQVKCDEYDDLIRELEAEIIETIKP